MSIDHTKVVSNDVYFHSWSKIRYIQYEGHSVLRKCEQIVRSSTTAPSTEESSDYFKAIWKTKTQNSGMQQFLNPIPIRADGL